MEYERLHFLTEERDLVGNNHPVVRAAVSEVILVACLELPRTRLQRERFQRKFRGVVWYIEIMATTEGAIAIFNHSADPFHTVVLQRLSSRLVSTTFRK